LYKYAERRKLSLTPLQGLEKVIGYTDKLNSVENLMLKNAGLAEDILEYSFSYYGVSRTELEDFVQETTNGTNNQKGSTLYAMKHFVRDWSQEGLHEREFTYPCILAAMQAAFPRRSHEPIKVLVPGSGLGRLGHEIAALGGFQVTLNEFSYSMNMAYHYLATLKTSNAMTIHPYVDWWSHRATTAHLTRPVSFPDDIDFLTQPSVSLVEGEFTTCLEHHEGTYDALVSHFFIDTATNILNYLETIHAMLKPGGVWINFGPLLYGSMPALQLSLDEVIAMAESLGFELEPPSDACGKAMEFDHRVRGAHVPYSYDTESLSRNAYLAQHWVARKKR
jgi:SAM-dependent methyltransferase